MRGHPAPAPAAWPSGAEKNAASPQAEMGVPKQEKRGTHVALIKAQGVLAIVGGGIYIALLLLRRTSHGEGPTLNPHHLRVQLAKQFAEQWGLPFGDLHFGFHHGQQFQRRGVVLRRSTGTDDELFEERLPLAQRHPCLTHMRFARRRRASMLWKDGTVTVTGASPAPRHIATGFRRCPVGIRPTAGCGIGTEMGWSANNTRCSSDVLSKAGLTPHRHDPVPYLVESLR